jgi:hypothetical protein
MPRKQRAVEPAISDEESLEQAFAEDDGGEPGGGDSSEAETATETTGDAAEIVESTAGGSSEGGSAAAASDASQPSASLRERLSSRGYDTSAFESEDDAFDALLTTVEQYHQSQPYIQGGQRYASHQEEFERWLAEQQQAKQPEQKPVPEKQPTAESPALDWKPPEFNQDFLRFVEPDPRTGRYKPIEPSLQRYADAANQYADWERETGRKILHDFPTLVEQAVSAKLAEREKALAEAFEKKLEERFQTWESSRENTEFVSQREKDFFVTNEAGQKLVDPRTNQFKLTPKGEAFRDYCNEAREFGLEDANKIRQYAERHLVRDEQFGRFKAEITPAGANGNGASPPAAEVGEGKRKQFMSRVLRSQRAVARTGSVPPPGSVEQQNPDATIDEIFDEVAEAAGVKPRN